MPVFAVDPEVAYLSAFTNSMMVEISRLEALTANKMKSDFISSISRAYQAAHSPIVANDWQTNSGVLFTAFLQALSFSKTPSLIRRRQSLSRQFRIVVRLFWLVSPFLDV